MPNDGATAGGGGVDLRHAAVAVWALSWLGMFGAYAASAVGDHVPGCVPHFSGCASVSASGRHGAGFFVFKALMIPAAALLLVYWALCERWLAALGDRRTGWRRAMLAVGAGGAAALVVYAVFLGADDDAYYRVHRALRRYGTVAFFGFTYLAQLLLAHRARALLGDSRLVLLKVALCVWVLAEGLVLEALTLFVEDDDWAENLVEWHVATAMAFYPFLTWRLWRHVRKG